MTRRLAFVAFVALVALVAIPAGTVRAGEDGPTTLIHPPFHHCLGIHRVTEFHRFVYLGTRTSFEEPAGIAAVKLVAEDDPTTASDDDELTVFGLNSGRCEIIYNTSLYDVEIFGECGGGPGQFSSPLGIAADELGNVFVADTGNDRIVRLLYRDGALRFVKSFGSAGAGQRGLSSPSQISVGASGRLYVSDTGNDRIVVLTSTGEPVAALEGETSGGTRLERPVGLAAVEGDDPWITGNLAFIVAADRGGTRLVRLALDGSVEAVVESEDLPIEGASFGYLAIDYYGNVYATDRSGGRLHKFDRRLRYVTSIGGPGNGEIELDEPRGIALWRRFGQIFVTEREGAQYFWIGTDALDFSVEPPSIAAGIGRATVTYRLTETSRVTLEVLDDDGATVHTIVDHRRRAIGENRERWDGTAGPTPAPLPPGRYTLRLTAVPTYSSRQHFRDISTTEIELLDRPRR